MTTLSTAPGWEAWSGHYEQQVAAVMRWLVDAVAEPPRDGLTVLDLACGPGQPAIPAAARLAGTGGRVIATDVAADMVAACGRLAAAAGVANVELREMDMHAIALPDASVDAVTCAFALMFSPDAGRVLAEIRRVLRPGGRVALAVWDGPERNPFFTTLLGAIGAVPQAGEPGPFRLAVPGELARLLAPAGFTGVTVEAVPITMAFDSVDHHWEMNRDMAAPLKRLALSLPADELAALRARLAAAIEPYRRGDRVELPATALCAAGRRA